MLLSQMSWFYYLLASACAFCAHLVLRSLKHNKKLEALAKLPGFRPRFLIGNLHEFGFLKLRDKKRLISDMFYTRLGMSSVFHKEGLCVIWLGPMPLVLITRARTAEVILSSQVLIDKSRVYDTFAESMGTGLISSTGDKWRQDRKLFTPAFHSRILNESLDVMSDHSAVLVDLLRRKSAGRKWLDPQDAINNCVLDILLDLFMDMHVHAQTESSEYLTIINRLVDMFTERIYSPWFYSSIYYLFPKGREFWKLTQCAHGIVDKVLDEKISERKDDEKSGTGPKTFLDILLEQKMSPKELRDQTNAFVAAGHHTVGTSLSWLLYLLGLHKDVQSKLFDEIISVFPGGVIEKVTKEHLKTLSYMDCVIKECHRLYPSVPDIGRLLSEDTVIDGYTIPKGTDCIISIAAIHRDPDIYPDPELFDPDRFLLENCAGQPSYAFVPFSAGPRNCIGQLYAHMKMKVILCHVIGKLTVHSLDPEDKIKVIAEIVSKPLEPLRIVFEPRNVST